jgi:hypothetical protein
MSKKINFATYSSYRYLPQFLQFYKSINKYNNSVIYVLCIDEKIYSYLKKNKLNNVKIFNSQTLKINNKKKINQYIAISRLRFVKYLFKKGINEIHLIDSDVFFYSNPTILEKIVKKFSIAFCYHNFFLNSTHFENRYGIYNAGYIFLKNNIDGNFFLEKYISLCEKELNWDVINNIKNNFADQTYLEYLDSICKNILKIRDKGINYGPWNIENYSITLKKGFLFTNNTRLIFYHFSGVKKINKNTYSLGLRQYVKNKKHLKIYIYNNYIAKIFLSDSNKGMFNHNGIKNKFLNSLRLLKVYLHKDYLKVA